MIRTRLQGDVPFFPNMLNSGKVEVCLKEDVDKAIEEKDAEIRRLKRALYKACVNWMRNRQTAMRCFDFAARAEKFYKAIEKCQAKAEELADGVHEK